jgi:DNA-binding response OmpR family regulator
MIDYNNSASILNQAEHYSASNRNVLVIEDDRIMGEMITDTLDEVGFEVTAVSNGRAALERLKQDSVNFILLDLSLPGMNGFEIFNKLRQYSNTKDIPVIMATAWDDDRNRKHASEVGIQHILPKPFTDDELLGTILSLLGDKSSD